MISNKVTTTSFWLLGTPPNHSFIFLQFLLNFDTAWYKPQSWVKIQFSLFESWHVTHYLWL